MFNLYKSHPLLSVYVEGNENSDASVSFIFLFISAQCTEMELRGPIYLNKVRTQAANNARTDFINCRCFMVIHWSFDFYAKKFVSLLVSLWLNTKMKSKMEIYFLVIM